MNMYEIKQSVKAFMQENGKVAYGLTVIPLLVGLVLSGIGSTIPFFSLLYAPINLLIMMLVQVTFLAMARKEVFSFEKHIVEHGKELGGSYIILSIVSTLYISLWTLLFFIPGIVKTYAYSLAPFIQHDNPNLTANEVLKESIRLTDGKKGQLFWLYLRYYAGVLVSLGMTYVFGMIALLAGFATDSAEISIGLFSLVGIFSAIATIAFSIRATPRWHAALSFIYEESLKD